MARNINARTLFHLVPLNQLARDALLLPENSSYVSPSHASASDVQLGLEIGFHVPLKPAGRVITRLGRDADLILPERHISAIHIAFEIHPDTLVTLLSVRSKRSSQVIVQSIEGNADRVEGDCVLLYGQNYTIRIVHYEFQLIWRNAATVESLRALVAQEYRNSLQRLQFVRPRDLPTDIGSELHTWHQTRLHTAKRILFREAEGEPRTLIGQGRFGDVFRAVDLESGNAIAVKVVRLSSYPNVELARVALHREIKALEKLKHKNIIECLNTAKWDSSVPEIFMPLRLGTLRSLAQASDRPCTDDSLCWQVLEQMLCALDYLAVRGMCHRDVKPENILYGCEKDEGIYSFQLADFGLVNHQQFATTRCGTCYYQAPELHPDYGIFPQSPKMDVWSLFATIIDVHRTFDFPPRSMKNYDDILQAIWTTVTLLPQFADMVRENPAHRASAAQLLVAHFGGRGLTTPRAKVLPISPPPQEAEPNHRQSRAVSTSVAVPEAPLVPPLIVHPAHRRRTPKAGPVNVRSKPPTKQQKPPLLSQKTRPRCDRVIKKSTPSKVPRQPNRGIGAWQDRCVIS